MVTALQQAFSPIRPPPQKDVVAINVEKGQVTQILADPLPPPNADHRFSASSANIRFSAAQGYDDKAVVQRRREIKKDRMRQPQQSLRANAREIYERTTQYALTENLAGSNSHAEVHAGKLPDRALTAYDMAVQSVTRPLLRGQRDSHAHQYMHTQDGTVSNAPAMKGNAVQSRRHEQLNEGLRNTSGPAASNVLPLQTTMPITKREAQTLRQGASEQETTGSYSVALQTLRRTAQRGIVSGGSAHSSRSGMRPSEPVRYSDRTNVPAQSIRPSGGPAHQPLLGEAVATRSSLGMGTTLPLPSSNALHYKGPITEQERKWFAEPKPAYRLNAGDKPRAAPLRQSRPDRPRATEETRWSVAPRITGHDTAGPVTMASRERSLVPERPFQPVPAASARARG